MPPRTDTVAWCIYRPLSLRFNYTGKEALASHTILAQSNQANQTMRFRFNLFFLETCSSAWPFRGLFGGVLISPTIRK